MDQDEILLDAEDRMEKAVNIFQDQLQGLRTGRATPGLVDSIRVDYYGSPTPLKQLATISAARSSTSPIRYVFVTLWAASTTPCSSDSDIVSCGLRPPRLN